MNRKEATVVGAILLVSFTGGVFAAPAIQQTLIVNDPLNVRIVDSGTPQTTSVDIEIFKSETGVYVRCCDVIIAINGGFSFAPHSNFVQVNSILLTIVHPAPGSAPNSWNVQLNGQTTTTIPMLDTDGLPGVDVTTVGTLNNQDLRLGSNSISVSVTGSGFGGFVREIRLTVEYTFLG